MAVTYKDRVKESSTSTGTGNFTLAGASNGFQTFDAAFGHAGNSFYYVIQAVDANGVPTGAWEVGLGHLSAAATLVRDGVIASTNSNALVNFAAGTKDVFADIPADLFATIVAHLTDTANPHSVTKSQVGLSNVDNTSDVNKPISTATQAALDAKQPLDADLTAIAALTTTAYGRALLALADAAAFRTVGGLVIGMDVQAYNALLAQIASLTLTQNSVLFAGASNTVTQNNARFQFDPTYGTGSLKLGDATAVLDSGLYKSRSIIQAWDDTPWTGNLGHGYFGLLAAINRGGNNGSAQTSAIRGVAHYTGTSTSSPNLAGMELFVNDQGSTSNSLFLQGAETIVDAYAGIESMQCFGSFSSIAGTSVVQDKASGVYLFFDVAAGAVVPELYGYYARYFLGGTITKAAGLQVLFERSYAGTTTNLYGVKVGDWVSSTHTVLNSYGLHIDATIDVGTNSKYAIKSDSTSPSVFAGTLAASNLSGTNTGDQTSIVGISGTKAQFNTAVSDGDILFVGDVTQYTDEMTQDAVGAMVDTTLTYVDATPLLQRAAITGDVSVPAGTNAAEIKTGLSYDPGSITLSTEKFLYQYQHLKLTGSERLTMAGTARMILADEGQGQPCILGSPRTPTSSFTMPTEYFYDALERFILDGSKRGTMQGTARMVITDDFKTRSRIVLAGGPS